MLIAPGVVIEIKGKLIKTQSYSSSHLMPVTFVNPEKVLVLGKSMRYAGALETDEYGWKHMMYTTESKLVWMVMPLMGNRYRKPFPVLPEQIVQSEL